MISGAVYAELSNPGYDLSEIFHGVKVWEITARRKEGLSL